LVNDLLTIKRVWWTLITREFKMLAFILALIYGGSDIKPW